MLKVRILTRLNSQYGTFEAGEIVVNLPDDVANAWISAGIAEIPVRAAAFVHPPPVDNPELDDLILPDNPEPVKTADTAGKKSSRRRVPATHPSGHEGPMREDPKRPAQY